MAEDGKIYIIITDERGVERTGAAVGTDVKLIKKESSATQESNTTSGFLNHQFFNFVDNQAKQFVNFNVNNIGNFTGDYIAQRKANEGMSALSTMIGIGMAFKAGGVIGGIIAVAGVAINKTYSYFAGLEENRKVNYNIEQLRKRSGLNIYYDESRGTEN